MPLSAARSFFANRVSNTSTFQGSGLQLVTPANAPPAGATAPQLRVGDLGADVVKLQQALARHGFGVGVDGNFGSRTRSAVVGFQRAKGLEADGVVGLNTWRALAGPVDAPPPGSSTPVTSSGPVTGPTTGGLSAAQLRAIMPNLSSSQANTYLPALNAAMAEGQINTPKRQAAFLAQLAHESVELRFFEELASGAAYEGRRDLGNTQPGDGVRFKGRGPIQLTGRSNYAAAGAALGLDLINQPKLASNPAVGFRIAQWFWNSRDLNSYADAGNFDAITRRVNGGFRGKASRDAYYATARRVLGG